ncbi:MAG: hypothetical protein ACRD2J_16850, partial [Thermoanaerobaculia bacterium]
SEPVAERRASAPAPTASGDLAGRLIAAVARERRAMATYLERAGTIRFAGGTLAIEFNAGDDFAADYLREPANAQFLTDAASRLGGGPVTLNVRIAPAKEDAKAPSTAPGQDDPVLRSFQRHLGGEVVPRKPRGKSQEER